ncbi:unnamed protein product [Diamesa serratosioi]
MDVMMESMGSLSVVSTENDVPEVRKSSRRSVSEQSLHKTNRRTICKPKKKNIELDSGNQTAIKNFYLNINKSSKFKAIPLETIYEQNEDEEEVDEVNISSSSQNNQKDIGTRKIKRCLTVTSGLKANKTLSNKRKSQIKKHLGPRKRSKKISINNFMEYLKSQTNQTEDVDNSESTEIVIEAPVIVNSKED